jgi:IrrE N-terminal-like domain
MIILNLTHERVRQKATLAEELARIVMGHPPSSIDPVTGFRTYNRDVEDEAYGVGGAMVLPYSQLFPLARRGTPTATIAARYALSDRFVNYRINRAGLRQCTASDSARELIVARDAAERCRSIVEPGDVGS